MRKKQYLSFESARKYVRQLKLKNINEYQKWFRKNKPNNLPSKPERTYKDEGWDGYGDWLGTGRIADKNKEWMSFKAAKKFTNKLKLRNTSEWKEYCKSGDKPIDIPSTPNQVYKRDGWIDWPDWLGNGNLSNKGRIWLTFEKCQKFAQKNNITSQIEWAKFGKSGKRPSNVPSHPDREFTKQWNGWPDFLGTDRVAHRYRQFKSYKDAKAFAISLNLKTQLAWKNYWCTNKIPKDIPVAPDITYKKQGTWNGWGDFLGTGAIANQNKEYLSAKEAKPVYQKLFKEYGIKIGSDWPKFAKTHKKLLEELHIPADVLVVYNLEKAKKRKKQK